MGIKGNKDFSGCFTIVCLIVGFLLVKNIIWPLLSDNKGIVGSCLVGVLICVVAAALIFYPARNIFRKWRFLRQYGKRLEAKDRISQESQKIVKGIMRDLTELEAEVQRLSQEVRDC